MNFEMPPGRSGAAFLWPWRCGAELANGCDGAPVTGAQAFPKLFIFHHALVLRTPVRIDPIPSVPLENVPTLRAKARPLERDFSPAAKTGGFRVFHSNPSGERRRPNVTRLSGGAAQSHRHCHLQRLVRETATTYPRRGVPSASRPPLHTRRTYGLASRPTQPTRRPFPRKIP
jgi:hypothetical protein